MKVHLLAAWLVIASLFVGCKPAEPPAESLVAPVATDVTSESTPESDSPATGAAQATDETAGEMTEAEAAETEAASVETAQVPAYTAEQIAAAKQLAMELGVVVKEDSEGNVVAIDTAANRSWAGDYQMQEMLVFPKLTSLTLEGPDITDALAPRIAEQSELTSLALRNTMLGDEGIAQFQALKKLKIIDLRVSPMVTDATMQILANMPELRAVRVSGCNVGDAGLIPLLSLPRLSELDLRNCRGVTKAGFESLATKQSLRVLKIGGPKVDDEVLGIVAGIGTITTLSLDNCNITDQGVAALGQLALVDLTVYQCANVSDLGLQVLVHYPDLQRLTLRDVPAQGAALAKLPNPDKLISLNLAQSGIEDGEVVHLAGMTNLESLNLSETVLTDQCVQGLTKLSSLKQLVLTQTGVTAEGAQRLVDALPDCKIQVDGGLAGK